MLVKNLYLCVVWIMLFSDLYFYSLGNYINAWWLHETWNSIKCWVVSNPLVLIYLYIAQPIEHSKAVITTNIFSNSILSHYRTIKHLEVFAKRCIDQKQNRMPFWNHEYFSMPQNVLQHTDTLNTELLR